MGFSSNAVLPCINFIIIVSRFPSIAIKWLIRVIFSLISASLKISHSINVPSLAIFSPSPRIARKFSFREVHKPGWTSSIIRSFSYTRIFSTSLVDSTFSGSSTMIIPIGLPVTSFLISF